MMSESWTPSKPLDMEVANRFLNGAPVDLEGMAEALGINLKLDPRLSSDISGKIVCVNHSGDRNYTIVVNANHSETRRRFTLAHEIAHFILHKPFLNQGVTDNEMYRSGLGDRMEYEANRLAAELLMPAALVRTAYRAGAKAIAPLATAFGASEEAMRIRLKQLGFGP